MLRVGDDLALTIEKPAAGGRMLARHDGQVVLVAGTIPGERVRARIEAVRGGVAFASTSGIDEASPDRRPAGLDPACGGSVFAHVAYPRQLSLKREILVDAFTRLAHLEVPADIDVHGSPERGYRMRARLHVHGAQVGFYREGSHRLCDPAASGQLLDSTVAVVQALSAALTAGGVTTAVSVDVSENIDASERAIAVDLTPERREPGKWDGLLALDGVTGALVSLGGRMLASRGDLVVRDRIPVTPGGESSLTLGRRVSGFFQGNRFLLTSLVERVLAHVPEGAVADLYAGVGLFGLAHVAAGHGPAVVVESDRLGIEDLRANATAVAQGVTVHAVTVEAFLRSTATLRDHTVVVDPPRTGLSKQAGGALAASDARRIVYVSCDVATLARDARRLVDGGFSLSRLELFDLFPNTAHVEALAVFVAGRPI